MFKSNLKSRGDPVSSSAASKNRFQSFTCFETHEEGLFFLARSSICTKSTKFRKTGFMLNDIGLVERRHTMWTRHLPSVKIYYPLKCNADPCILNLMSSKGADFLCFSVAEIQRALSYLTGDRIVFANPIKAPPDIKWAHDRGVKKMVFDSEDEMRTIVETTGNQAQLILRLLKPKYNKRQSFNVQRQFMNIIPPLLTFGMGVDYTIMPEKLHQIFSTAVKLNCKIIGTCLHLGKNAWSFTDAEKENANANANAKEQGRAGKGQRKASFFSTSSSSSSSFSSFSSTFSSSSSSFSSTSSSSSSSSSADSASCLIKNTKEIVQMAFQYCNAVWRLALSTGLAPFTFLDMGGGFADDDASHKYFTLLRESFELFFPQRAPTIEYACEPGRFFVAQYSTFFTFIVNAREHPNLKAAYWMSQRESTKASINFTSSAKEEKEKEKEKNLYHHLYSEHGESFFKTHKAVSRLVSEQFLANELIFQIDYYLADNVQSTFSGMHNDPFFGSFVPIPLVWNEIHTVFPFAAEKHFSCVIQSDPSSFLSLFSSFPADERTKLFRAWDSYSSSLEQYERNQRKIRRNNQDALFSLQLKETAMQEKKQKEQKENAIQNRSAEKNSNSNSHLNMKNFLLANFHGNSGSGGDVICSNLLMKKRLDKHDWLMFKNIGAYGLSSSSFKQKFAGHNISVFYFKSLK